jgi:hypothetical protein
MCAMGLDTSFRHGFGYWFLPWVRTLVGWILVFAMGSDTDVCHGVGYWFLPYVRILMCAMGSDTGVPW